MACPITTAVQFTFAGNLAPPLTALRSFKDKGPGRTLNGEEFQTLTGRLPKAQVRWFISDKYLISVVSRAGFEPATH